MLECFLEGGVTAVTGKLSNFERRIEILLLLMKSEKMEIIFLVSPLDISVHLYIILVYSSCYIERDEIINILS